MAAPPLDRIRSNLRHGDVGQLVGQFARRSHQLGQRWSMHACENNIGVNLMAGDNHDVSEFVAVRTSMERYDVRNK